MKPSLRGRRAPVASLSIGIALIASACGQTVFQAAFEQDTVGATPALSPPEDPTGDAIVILGSPSLVQVINAPILGSQAVEIERGSSSTEMGIECVPVGGPFASGVITIIYGAYLDSSIAQLSASVLSSSGEMLGQLNAAGGQLHVTAGGQTQTLGTTYASGDSLFVVITFDLDNDTFKVNVNNSSGTSSQSNPVTVTSGAAVDFAVLRLAYPPAIVEAIPATCVADAITIKWRG